MSCSGLFIRRNRSPSFAVIQLRSTPPASSSALTIPLDCESPRHVSECLDKQTESVGLAQKDLLRAPNPKSSRRPRPCRRRRVVVDCRSPGPASYLNPSRAPTHSLCLSRARGFSPALDGLASPPSSLILLDVLLLCAALQQAVLASCISGGQHVQAHPSRRVSSLEVLHSVLTLPAASGLTSASPKSALAPHSSHFA